MCALSQSQCSSLTHMVQSDLVYLGLIELLICFIHGEICLCANMFSPKHLF